ncbi:MAG: methyltransferase domain-containing protein [Coxiellaceae bacterium]|nr:methyltransferase domain-containing protein [Coxiellaceae bacterium]
MSVQNVQEWFETSLGKYLLDYEQRYFDQAVANIFGYNAVQIGLTQFDFLQTNRMPLRFCVGTDKGTALCANPDFLPIKSGSMDLVLLPHVLEFNSNPHQILREVYRILMPEGHVVISGFNPLSLWGMHQYFERNKREFPWCGNFIALPRLKDWLKLLNFEMTGGRLCCYTPPFKQEKWRKRFNFMEAAGDRWWPISGGVYFLQAVKHVHGMHIIKPGWKHALAGKKRMAPATQRCDDRPMGSKHQMTECKEIKIRKE